jgi:hypothetical protein
MRAEDLLRASRTDRYRETLPVPSPAPRCPGCGAGLSRSQPDPDRPGLVIATCLSLECGRVYRIDRYGSAAPVTTEAVGPVEGGLSRG